MNDLQIFNFNGSEIREITDKNGEPWFVAGDVCSILEIKNSRDAVSRLDPDEKNTVVLNDGTPGNPERTIVSESGLYSLVMNSRKPEAKEFRKWVTSEVLPSIRKTGSYSTPKLSEDELLRNAFLILDGRVKNLEAKIEQDKDKVQFFHDVTGSKDAIEMGKVAKLIDCGMGRNRLFEFLRENKILRQNNEPYQKYIDSGWFRVIEQKYEPSPGEIKISIKTLVYQKGIDGITKLIRTGK